MCKTTVLLGGMLEMRGAKGTSGGRGGTQEHKQSRVAACCMVWTRGRICYLPTTCFERTLATFDLRASGYHKDLYTELRARAFPGETRSGASGERESPVPGSKYICVKKPVEPERGEATMQGTGGSCLLATAAPALELAGSVLSVARTVAKCAGGSWLPTSF